MYKISYHFFIALIALFLTLFCNTYFFELIASMTSWNKLLLIGALLFALLGLALEILSLRWSAKWIIAIILLLSASFAYSINSLRTGITPNLLYSILSANPREIQETLNFSFLLHLFLLGVLPTLGMIFFIKFPKPPFKKALFHKIITLLSYALFIGILWPMIGKDLTFIFKKNRTFYYITNPISPIRSAIQALDIFDKQRHTYTQIALDAKLSPSPKPKFIVFIIGESARSINFSLNGYSKETNPYTSKQNNLLSFRDFSSCGIITAISVPCMMTDYTQRTYTKRYLSDFRDNILDVTQRVGIDTFYIGNNGGGCIGNICARLPKSHVKFYNDGNLDGVMLKDLKQIIHDAKNNTFVILHQMGSHGQSYFKRYPPEFRRFTPTCDSAQIQACSLESLVNTYDNSLLYTDFFINEAIKQLKTIGERFDVALWYVSDHGESLGENGMYMHGGLPYFLAPQTQIKVPSILWLGKGFESLLTRASKRINDPLSQDFVFHTLLRLWGINSKVYNASLDIFNTAHQ